MEEEQQFVHAQLSVHSTYERERLEYELTVRQEPKQARMCGVGADRRPIDPPPIVQLRVIDPSQRRHSNDSRADSPDVAASLASQSFLQNPYYFMFATLAKPDEDVELHWLKDGKTRCTTGSVVSSLYHLKDTEAGGADAGFFVFPDLSVRTEGSYRLKLSLFEVVGIPIRLTHTLRATYMGMPARQHVSSVYHCKSIFSAPFYVYTAKKFPGMEESTPLSCSLADQGIKIRIRKDIRVRKRPLPGNEAPTPIPIPIPGPPQSGAFGPVPVRLDDSEADEERGQDEGSHRILDGPHLTESPIAERSRGAESEKESPREEPRRMSGRRDSGGSCTRRDSTSERGTKRIRADDSGMTVNTGASASGSMSGGYTDGTQTSPVSAGPSSAGWGPIDPALAAPPPPVTQPTAPPTSPGEHHYASAPAPHSAPPPPSYEQRYPPAPAQLSAPPPTPGSAPAPYPYSEHHAQHAPPPPVHHYSAPPPPHPYAHVPPPPPVSQHHPYSYPPASAPGQPWYDPYAHHQPYGVPPPPSHHPHAHHAPPPPRYGEYPAYAPQPYAYYEHAPPPHHQQPPAQHQSQHQVQPQHQVPPPPPPSHHSHHVYHHPGYGAAPAPSPPPTSAPSVSYDYSNHPAPSHTSHAADTRSQSNSAGAPVQAASVSSRGYTPAGYGSAPPPVSAPSAATHHHYAPPPPSPYAQYGHSTQAHQQSSQNQASSASQTGSRGQYQLSTPPHQHQSGYSTYPPVPGSGGGGGSLSSAVSGGASTQASSSGTNPASADGSWGYAQNTNSWAVGGQGVMMQNDAYGSYAGSATGGRDVHRIQLAPLRGSQVSPPPQSGDRSAAGGKKNPLSIGNIISDDTR